MQNLFIVGKVITTSALVLLSFSRINLTNSMLKNVKVLKNAREEEQEPEKI